MSKIICVKVSKGGVGKTTISSNLGYLFADKGNRVLMIDLDSQANLVKSFVKSVDFDKLTSSNLLGDENFDLVNSVYKLSENLDVIGADIGLSEVAKFLESGSEYYNRLNEVFEKIKIKDKYDFVFLDLPPGVSDSITEIALCASDLVVCPTHFDVDSLSGIVYTIEDISRLSENGLLKQDIKYLVVPNRYDKRFEKDNKIISDMIYDNLEEEFISIPIRENSHIKKARMRGITAIEYEELPENKYGHKKATEDFEKLCEKVLSLF